MEMDGLDLILELTRAFLHVKVIAMSGASDLNTGLRTAKLLGVRQSFPKPLSLEALLKAIDYELAH